MGQRYNTDGLATKLNRLKEKSAKYVSHKDFLSQIIKNKLFPKGLQFTLEPTIGNFGQQFIENLILQPEKVFCLLMNQIVTFWDKTIKEANDKIDQTDSILKSKLEKAE